MTVLFVVLGNIVGYVLGYILAMYIDKSLQRRRLRKKLIKGYLKYISSIQYLVEKRYGIRYEGFCVKCRDYLEVKNGKVHCKKLLHCNNCFLDDKSFVYSNYPIYTASEFFKFRGHVTEEQIRAYEEAEAALKISRSVTPLILEEQRNDDQIQ